MRLTRYPLSVCFIVATLATSASAMPIDHTFSAPVSGSSGSFEIDVPATTTDGNDGNLSITGAFFGSTHDFDLAIESGDLSFTQLEASSSRFTPFVDNGPQSPVNGTLTKMFTLPGSLLQAAVSDGILRFFINQPPADVFGNETRNFSGVVSFNDGIATIAPIPEPATMTLLGLGAVAAGGAFRRRRLAAPASV